MQGFLAIFGTNGWYQFHYKPLKHKKHLYICITATYYCHFQTNLVSKSGV
jgi:hypothetical protein